MENHLFGAGFGERTATVAYIFLQYLKLFFFPHPLSSDYSFNQTPIVGWTDPLAIASLLVHLTLVIFSLLTLKKYFTSDKPGAGMKEIISFGIIYYLIHLSLVSNLIFNIGAPMGERFTYLASLGACMAVVGLLFLGLKAEAGNEPSWSAKPSLIILALCLPLAGKTFVRNADWKNNETLFVADAEHAPRSAKAHYYLGNTLYNFTQENKTDPNRNEYLIRAKSAMYKALDIHPGFHHAWNKLGLIYNELKNADSAIYCLEKVLATVPENVNLSPAEKKKVQTLDKTAVDALTTLGTVYGQLKNDLEKSIYYLNESLRYNPNNLQALQNLGVAYAVKGDAQNAIATFEKALNLDPNNGNTYLNIGKLYGNAGNKQKMEEYFAKAKALGVEIK